MHLLTKSRQEKSIFEITIEMGPCQAQEMAGKVILIIPRPCNFGIKPFSLVTFFCLTKSGKVYHLSSS